MLPTENVALVIVFIEVVRPLFLLDIVLLQFYQFSSVRF